MRMLLSVDFPNEPFNSLVQSGEIGKVMGEILEAIKPEAAYFTEHDGLRGGMFIVDVQKPSDVPSFAEPFFLTFDAECRFRIVMSPDELKSSGIEDLGMKWT